MRLSIGEIASCLGVACPAGRAAALISGVSTDSRQIHAGDLFVCIRGEKADGHSFARDAARTGAGLILASHAVDSAGAPVLIVEDTVRALGALASCWRKKTSAKVICITGTCGKTTLKDTLAAILAGAGKTAATAGNLNNQIGLPRAVLAADGDEDFWVLEAGISHEGDMEELGAIAKPDIAIILNVGPGHTEGLGGKGVAWHKTRLLEHLAPNGIALINADYPQLPEECAKLGISPVFFSSGERNVPFSVLASDAGKFRLKLGNAQCVVETPFHGAYGAENTIAAACAASLAGLDCRQIQAGFEAVKLPAQRFSLARVGNCEVFDDTYNANPLSMRRMLEAAAAHASAAGLPFIAMLGEMGELGSESASWHFRLGQLLAKLGLTAVFWKGGYQNEVRRGLEGAGGASIVFEAVDAPEKFIDGWVNLNEEKPALADGCVIIFKGSRSNRLEKFLDAFKKCAQEAEKHVL